MKYLLTGIVIFFVLIFFYLLNFEKFSYFKFINFLSADNSSDYKNFEKCEVKKSNEIFQGSQVFIGHAYGNPDTAKLSDFVSKNAENFIRDHSSLVSHIIFTGDVFSVPSIEKWRQLRELAGNDVDIIIAPGNHDFLRPDSRDVFLQSEFSSRKYPFIVNVDGASIIIENSIETFWSTSKKTFDLAKLTDQETVIIARHNSPVIEFSNIVNSKSGMPNNLDNVVELIKHFENNKSYIWVIGDSGAFPYLPRIMCLTYKNHKFILNGLGQTDGDTVLIYNKNQIYQYKL